LRHVPINRAKVALIDEIIEMFNDQAFVDLR